MNLVEAELRARNGSLAARIGGQELELDPELLAQRPGLAAYAGRTVVLGVRPENLEDAALAPDTPSARRLRGSVVLREALGSDVVAHFGIDARPALTEDVRELARDLGDERRLGDTEHAVLVGRFGARSALREGESADVAVDTRELHFFELETGQGIYEKA